MRRATAVALRKPGAREIDDNRVHDVSGITKGPVSAERPSPV